MTATGHALIGAAIASQVSNPIVGLPLALISHFFADKVPHWDPMTDKNKGFRLTMIQTVLDVLLGYFLVGIMIVLFWSNSNPVYILLGSFFAQIPDWLEVPYSIFKVKWPFFYQNYLVQHWVHDVGFDSRLKAPWGIVSQLGVVIAIVLWAVTSKTI